MIEFSSVEKDAIVQKIKTYFEDELGQDLGQFEAEFVLDFFSKEVGAYYYNEGLRDAQTIVAQRVETLAEAIDELEKPTSFRR